MRSTAQGTLNKMASAAETKAPGISPAVIAADAKRDQAVVDKAIALCKPGAVFERDDVRTIEEAGDIIEARGGPATEPERRVLAQAEKLRFYYPKPLPVQPTPELDAKIAEAEAVVATEQVKVEAAKRLWLEAVDAFRRKPTNETQALLRMRELEWKDEQLAFRRHTVPLARLIARREHERRMLSLSVVAVTNKPNDQ